MRRLVSEDLSDRIHAQNLENIRHAVVEENDVTEEMARAFAGFVPQKPLAVQWRISSDLSLRTPRLFTIEPCSAPISLN